SVPRARRVSTRKSFSSTPPWSLPMTITSPFFHRKLQEAVGNRPSDKENRRSMARVAIFLLRFQIAPRQPAGATGKMNLLVALDVLDNVLNRFDLFRVLVGDFHLIFFFQCHNQLHDIKRVSAQILNKGSARGHLIFAHAELLADNFLDPAFYR